MKKLAFFLTIFCGLVSGTVFAQNPTTTGPGPITATATLNVELRPIQTIVIGGDNTVNLVYKTKEDYYNGVTANMKDHLIVYSTGGFAVKVGSKNEKLTSKNNEVKGEIEANKINLEASAGSGNSLSSYEFNEKVALNTEAKPLFSSTVGGTDLKFNVAYTGQGGDAYVNKYNNVENPTVYTTTVTYTIEAQ
ncbi:MULTISPECIES: hypothetical protein [unclassified Empedobacter]|uniref:hypothetical protein n=1 Tax=unclassified Empedobacter TaxID=2643773 RepID=UPI0025C09209|nr:MULTISPECIES: hypothetical protein [unclassified Empedobacter]